MAIKYSYVASDNGLTPLTLFEVGGTVTVVGDELRTTKTGGGGWSTGWILTADINPIATDHFYFIGIGINATAGNTYGQFGLTTDGGLSIDADSLNIYCQETQSFPSRDGGVSGTQTPWTPGDLVDYKYVFGASTNNMFIRPNGGGEGDWVQVATGQGPDLVGPDVTVQNVCDMGDSASGRIFRMKAFYWTDSGGLPNDIIYEDTFANDDDLTIVNPDSTVVNSSFTEVITLTDSSVDYNGFYADTTIVAGEEDTLAFSFKTHQTDSPLYISVGCGRGIDPTNFYNMTTHYPATPLYQAYLHHSYFGGQIVAVANTRYYFLVIFGSERQWMYYSTTGFSHTLADWTLFQSVIPDGIADVGETIRFFAYLSGGEPGDIVTVYPYQFRDNSLLVIANAPAPSDLSAVSGGQHAVLLSWTDNGAVDDETNINIERSLVGSGVGFSVIDSVEQGTTSYADTSLDPDTEYFYRLRSDFSTGTIHHYSSYTSEASATTSGDENITNGAIMLALGEL